MSSGTLGSERLPSSNTSNPSNAVLEALLKRRGNGGVNMSRAEYLHQKDRRLVAAQEDVRGALSSALEGVVAFVDGETLPPKEELKSMIIAHGGVFLQTDSSDVTHYICNRLPAAHIRRFQNGKLQHRRVVTVQWLVDSVAAGRKLDEEEFVVPAFRHPSQRALSFRPAQSEWYVSIRARHPGLELAASVRAAFATSAQPLSLVPLGEAELIAAAPVAEADLRSLWLPALGVLGVEGAGGVGRSLPLARLASFANLLGAVKPKDGDYAVWPRDATAEGRLVEARPLSMLLPDLTGADLSALSRAHVRTCGELVASIDRGGAACQLLGERANFIRALAASTEPLAPQCSDSVGEPQPREPREPLEQPTRKESEAELQALAVDGWRCPECTLINPAQYLQCDACCTHIPTESARGGGSSSASAISSRPTAVQDGIGNGKDSPLKRKSVKASPPKRNGRAKKAKKAKGSPPAQRKSPFHAPMGGSPEERRMREGRAPVSPIEIDMDDVDPYPSTSTVPATRAGEDSWPDLEPVLSEWLRLEPTPRAEPLLDAAESLFENMRAEDVKLMVLLLERECLPRREWHSSLREFVRRVDELSRKRYGGCFKPSEHIRHSLQSLEA